MTSYIAIPGTWGWRDRDRPEAWFRAGSPFAREVSVIGLVPLRAEPFLWTTRVNGAGFWRRWLAPVLPARVERGDHTDWQSNARMLGLYDEANGHRAEIVIAHSHGGQVAAYAIAEGRLRPRLLLTVSTPPRRDMRAIYEATRMEMDRHGGRWRHVYAATFDFWQRAGMFGDGALSVRVGDMPRGTAHDNYPVPGAGHTRVLNDPAFTKRWLVETGRLVA